MNAFNPPLLTSKLNYERSGELFTIHQTENKIIASTHIQGRNYSFCLEDYYHPSNQTFYLLFC
jgi:hypothetical protein